MKTGTLGEVYEGLPDVIDPEKMFSDEGETDCQSEELMFSGPKNEEVLSETGDEFVFDQQPNDVYKAGPVLSINLETSNDQCVYSEVRGVMPELETVDRLKLKNKSQNPRELSKKCDFIAETERANVQPYFAEFDEILQRKAIVVLERCALPSSSPRARTKNTKRAQREKRLAAYAEWQRKAKERETPELREKRIEKQNERFRRLKANETPGQRKKRLRARAERKRKAKERETPEQRETRLAAVAERWRKMKERETPEQREKRLAASNARMRKVLERETPEQYEKRLAAAAERWKKIKETETPEQREKRIERDRSVRAKETPEQREKRLAAVAEWKRKAKERETPEQRETRLANVREYRKNLRKIQKELIEKEMHEQLELRRLAVAKKCKRVMKVEPTDINEDGTNEPIDDYEVDVFSQDGNRIRIKCEVANEEDLSSEDVEEQNIISRKTDAVDFPSQHVKENFIKSEASALEEEDDVIEIDNKAIEQERLAQREKRIVLLEQRKKRQAYFAEWKRAQIKNETPEERKKRLASHAEYRRKQKETETPEQRKNRLEATAEYKRKWRENRTLKQMRECLESEDGLSSQDDNTEHDHFNSKQTSEQMTAEIAAKKCKVKAPVLLSYLLGHQTISTKISVVAASFSIKDRLLPQEGNENNNSEVVHFASQDVRIKSEDPNEENLSFIGDEENNIISVKSEVEHENYLTRQAKNYRISTAKEAPEQHNQCLAAIRERWRNQIKNDTPEQHKKCLAAIRERWRKEMTEGEMSQQLDKFHLAAVERYKRRTKFYPTVLNEDRFSPHDENNSGTVKNKPIDKNTVNFSSNRIKNEGANEREISSEDVRDNNIITTSEVGDVAEQHEIGLMRQAENDGWSTAQETLEQPNQCLVAATERCIMWMENVNSEQCKTHLVKDSEYWRKWREKETLEQHKERLAKLAKYRRKQLKNETPEEYEERLAKAAEYRKKRRENETPEQRKKRLAYFAEYKKKQIEKETPERRKARLAKRAEWKRKRKETETPEQRKERMEKDAEYWRKWRENKTPEQRKERLEKDAEYSRKRRENKRPEHLNRKILIERDEVNEDDFSSQDRNARIKSEGFFVVEDEEEDEIEIDFEAYITNVETKIKSDPIDEPKVDFFSQAIKSEDANEKHFSLEHVKEKPSSIKSEVVNENDELDFLSQYVNENFINYCESAAALEDEIDFEANGMNVKT